MRKKTVFWIVLIGALSVVLVASQATSGSRTSNLVPEDGLYGFTLLNPYYEAVSQRLLSPYSDRKCQAVFLPSFSEESAVYLQYDSDSSAIPAVVVALKMERQLWAEMHMVMEADAGEQGSRSIEPETQRKALLQIKSVVNRLEAPIDREVAVALELTWDAMLTRVQYPEKSEQGLDGETCHFANFTLDFGYRTGKVWSPSAGTLTYELVELAKALREYPSLSEAARKVAAQELQNRAQEMLARLKAID